MLNDPDHVRLSRKLDQAVRPKRAERHLEELQPERCAVGGANQNLLEARPQHPIREREANVQEQRRRQHVEGPPDGVEPVDVGQLKRREPAREATCEHQRAEPAGRPSQPSDGAGQNVRNGDPVEQPDRDQVDVVSARRHEDRAERDRARENRERPKHQRLRCGGEQLALLSVPPRHPTIAPRVA